MGGKGEEKKPLEAAGAGDGGGGDRSRRRRRGQETEEAAGTKKRLLWHANYRNQEKRLNSDCQKSGSNTQFLLYWQID